jgi:hypothetical protein
MDERGLVRVNEGWEKISFASRRVKALGAGFIGTHPFAKNAKEPALSDRTCEGVEWDGAPTVDVIQRVGHPPKERERIGHPLHW